MVEYGSDGKVYWQKYPEVGTKTEDDIGFVVRTELPTSHLEFDSAGKNM